MNIPDLINSGFQISGGLFIYNNVRVLLKHKTVKGISISSQTFFLCWALFNIYYFKALEQPISCYSGLLIVSGDIIWIAMMLYYRKYPGGKPKLKEEPYKGAPTWDRNW